LKIDKKYSTILFGIFVSLGMSFAMSLVLTLINLGLVSDFFEKWLGAFAVGFVVSLPTSLVIVPFARKIVDKLTMD